MNKRCICCGEETNNYKDVTDNYFEQCAKAYLAYLPKGTSLSEAADMLDEVLKTQYEKANDCLKGILNLADPKDYISRGLISLIISKNNSKDKG